MNRNPQRIRAICIQGIGDGVDKELLEDLTAPICGVFHLPCWVRDHYFGISFAFDAARRQYHSTAILQQMSRVAAGEDEIRLLGITESDLFVPVLTFVFGEAQLAGRCALVSLRRLREEFYGLPAREELLRERALKESVHELGHTFGLRHCADWRCAMASTHAVERLDVKAVTFCGACRRAVWENDNG